VRYQEHIAVNASATLNSGKASEVAELEATATVANSIRQRSMVKLPIFGSQIRRILRTQALAGCGQGRSSGETE